MSPWPFRHEEDDIAITVSYHNHTKYCDGAGTVAAVVEAAIQSELTEVGISSHAPLPFETDWAMREDDVAKYFDECLAARQEYEGRIKVYLGLELDFIPEPRVTEFQERTVLGGDFDYFVGSVHFLGSQYPPRTYDDSERQFADILHNDYADDIRALVQDYYRRVQQMAEVAPVTIIGHLDRIKKWNLSQTYWQWDESWYTETVSATLQTIAGSGKTVELNTLPWQRDQDEPYPARWILRRCQELAIPVVVSSDAHTPTDVVAEFDRAAALLAEVGVQPERLQL